MRLAACLGILALLLAAGAAGARRSARRPRAVRPPIQRMLIPFGPRRKRQMAAYSLRHYGERTWRLRHPRVIVEHIAVAPTAGAVFNAFVATPSASTGPRSASSTPATRTPTSSATAASSARPCASPGTSAAASGSGCGM